jgi:hypothetical protein
MWVGMTLADGVGRRCFSWFGVARRASFSRTCALSHPKGGLLVEVPWRGTILCGQLEGAGVNGRFVGPLNRCSLTKQSFTT